MRLGISLQPVVPDDVLRVARESERLGFDAVYMSGHVLGEPGATVLDPMTTLAAVAGGTETIGVATSVLLLPHYNPVLLANEAASLDVISQGRFTLAIGVGWAEPEFDALGVPFGERGARADDALEAMRALWSERPASYQGRFTQFDDALLGTPPHTPGGPPLWVGGHSDAAIKRALRFAAAWHCTGMTPDEVAEARERIARIGEQVGRDPETLELTSIHFAIPPNAKHNGFSFGHVLGGEQPTADAVVQHIGELAEQGISRINLLLPLTPETLLDGIAWVAEEVMPQVAAAR